MKIYDQLEVAFVENLASDPVTALQEGRFWYNTTTDVLKVRMNATTKTVLTTDLGLLNPMTTAGDTLYGLALGVAERLAKPASAPDGAWYLYDNANSRPTWSRTAVFENADTNVATTTAWSFVRKSSGTVAAGFGGLISLDCENAAGNNPAAVYLKWSLTTATDGAEVSKFGVWTRTAGAVLVENFSVSGAGLITLGGSGGSQTHVFNSSGGTWAAPAATSITHGYSINSTLYGYYGVSGATDSIITGSALGDGVFRTQGQNMLFSVNSGSYAVMKLSPSTMTLRSTGNLRLLFNQDTNERCSFNLSNNAGDYISGSAAGDMCITAQTQKIMFSATTGGAQSGAIATSHSWTFANSSVDGSASHFAYGTWGNQASGAADIALRAAATHATFTGYVLKLDATRAANSAYNLIRCFSGGSSDVEFKVLGDGTVSSDGGTAMGTPADYAEFFESLDGTELPIGVTVVLVGNKVRVATSADPVEDVIGVVRPNGSSAVVGNAAWSKWTGKYLMDIHGRYELDANGDRQLNPDYDESVEYVPRADRPEWSVIGLVGQVTVVPGQPVNPRWRKMEDINAEWERWFIR